MIYLIPAMFWLAIAIRIVVNYERGVFTCYYDRIMKLAITAAMIFGSLGLSAWNIEMYIEGLIK